MSSRFKELLSQDRTIFLDGAMGTMLQAKGMPAGVSPVALLHAAARCPSVHP